MLGAAFARLPQTVLAEAIGLIVEAAIVAGFTWHVATGYEAAKTAKERIAAAQARDEAQERTREVERALAAARQEVTDAQANAQRQVADTRAAFRADADGLRGQLAAALGSSQAAGDSLVACQRRAATAGNLLADGLRLQADLAGAAESHAADLRAVRAFDARAHEALKAQQAP